MDYDPDTGADLRPWWRQPGPWYSLPSWQEHLAYWLIHRPLRRLLEPHGIAPCRCTLIGHGWHRYGEAEVCSRMCCRGATFGYRTT